MMGEGDSLNRLGDLIGPVGARLGVQDARAAGHLWSQWADIVGPGVAAHAEPTSLRGGVLRVRADSPTWATEIAYLGEEIRRRAAAAVGDGVVLEVRVWTAPGRVNTSAAKGPARSSGVVRAEAPTADPAVALRRAREAWERRRRGLRNPSESG